MGGYVAVGLAAVMFALAAGRLERWSIGGPLVFTMVGLALGPTGLGAIEVPATGEVVKLVTELTLALLLFTDGAIATKVRHRLMGAPTAVTGIAVLENHDQFFGQKRVEFRAATKLRNLRGDLR